MKCGLLHLAYFEMGWGILNFSLLDFLFFSVLKRCIPFFKRKNFADRKRGSTRF